MSLTHLNTIYREFDIRGKYPEEITDDEVYKIAHALVTHFNVVKVAIGRDIRPSADALRDALTRGFVERGVTVVDLGLCTTPMSYFMCGSSDVDMTIMITASHMPSEYNGLKISVVDAQPVTGAVLQELRTIVGAHTFSEAVTHSEVISHSLQHDWITKFKATHDLAGSNLSIVIDPANMIGVLEIDTFKAFEPDITVHTICDTFDHTCPVHEANPMKHETLTELATAVRDTKSDLGIAFDGDADRVGFVDETGTPISSDLIGALLARSVLATYPGATVVYDIRSSKALPEEIVRLGGVPVRSRVGHTHIRTRMRAEDAVLGVELSGHFFFKDTYFSEGGPLPAFMIMELMKAAGRPLSALVAEVRKYHHSGEINSTITRTPADIYEALKVAFPTASIDTTDGLTLTTDSWWCNVRPSANDPVLRLNLEAHTAAEMTEMAAAVLNIIGAT